jgi:hypothetical protein
VPAQVAPAYAIWIDDTQRRKGEYVHVVDYAEFDTSSPGLGGEPGRRLGYGEWYERGLPIVCGPRPDPGMDDTLYEACVNVYDPSMVYGRWLAVPASALPVIEGAQVGLDLLVLGGGIGLTAVVVARRPPE